jgi:integrase
MMPAKKRFKTNYPGVYYIESTIGQTGKPEKIYYITYRRDGKLIEEKAGRQFQDAMTPARAASLRSEKMRGKQPSNKERRAAEKALKHAEKDKWTINRLWKEYKAQKPNLKGIVTDQNRYGNHIKPIFGDREPKDLSPFDVDRLRIKLLKKKAPGTVKNVMELLRRIINFGVRKHLCEGLTFKIEMPRVNNLKTEDLSKDQLKRLIDTIDKSKNIQAGNLMRMVLFTGMRRGELFKLRWSDIDFQRGFIRLKDPKGGPDQKIPLNDAARELLQTHPKKKSPHVFPGRGGKQRTDIKKAVQKIKEDAGLPKDFRPLHGLRHVYASMLASSGKVDLYTLQKLLTHKSPQMTQRYAHLRDEALKQASNVAGDLIDQVVNGKEKAEDQTASNFPGIG